MGDEVKPKEADKAVESPEDKKAPKRPIEKPIKVYKMFILSSKKSSGR